MIDIIVGGQGGDEGKGDFVRYLADSGKYEFCIKVGAPQAGHSTYVNGVKFGLSSVPCAFTNPKVALYLAAGSYIIPFSSLPKLPKFLEEVEKTGTIDRIKVDNYCGIITEAHTIEERADANLKGVGTVGTGAGKSLRDRVERKEGYLFAKDIPELKHFLADVASEIQARLEKGEHGLIEGTQGFRLSLLHSREFPDVTARDTTASTFAGEAGIGPTQVRDVYCVFKPYFTRVARGPMINEIKDEEKLKRYWQDGGETGTVSGRKRRIGEFDWEGANLAIKINGTTKLALTHLDMLDGFDKDLEKLTGEAKEFLEKFLELEKIYPYPKLAIVKYGPLPEDIVDLR